MTDFKGALTTGMTSVGGSHTLEKDAAVFHLPGHPLPAFVSLVSTAEGAPPVDLFMAALTRPVLLSTFSCPVKDTSQPLAVDPHDASACQLLAFKDHLGALKQREPELLVYGLSTQPPSLLSHLRAKLGLPYPLLSDTHGELAEKLDLPRDPKTGLLHRCVLLLREGQVTRIDYPLSQPDQAAVRAEYMLRRDAGEE